MAEYSFTVHVKAPPEAVFDLFTDPGRMHEWIGGLTRVTDMSGPPGQTGTSYTVWFGRMRSPTTVIEADRPRRFRSRFGNAFLRGEMEATFEPEGEGTTLIQRFRTEGLIPAISARIFATGSWRGSFRGELATFVRIAERDVVSRPPSTGQTTAD